MGIRRALRKYGVTCPTTAPCGNFATCRLLWACLAGHGSNCTKGSIRPTSGIISCDLFGSFLQVHG